MGAVTSDKRRSNFVSLGLLGATRDDGCRGQSLDRAGEQKDTVLLRRGVLWARLVLTGAMLTDGTALFVLVMCLL